MDSLIETFASNPAFVLLIIIFGFVIFIVLTVYICGMTSEIIKAKEFERTRREVAAYISEGSMTPEQGESLLATRPSNSRTKA